MSGLDLEFESERIMRDAARATLQDMEELEELLKVLDEEDTTGQSFRGRHLREIDCTS